MMNTGRRAASRVSRPRRIAFSLQCEAIERRLLLSTYYVTNANDSGSGSLRAQIEQVDSDTTPDTIDFSIPGSGIQKISLASALPDVTNSVVIDGTSQPGYQSSPLVVIDGSNLSPASNSSGLILSAGASTVRGLAIVGFSGSGIVLNSTSGNDVVASNYLGVEPSGTQAEANGTGLSVLGSPTNSIGGTTAGAGNVISGNSGAGILISASSGTSVFDNQIGVASDGTTRLGNGSDGMQIADSPDTQIGGTTAGESNVIGSNQGNGIKVTGASSGTTIVANAIGTDPTGKLNLGNSLNGVSLGASSVTIGGTSATAGNLIYHNGNGSVGAGVLLVGDVVDNSILSNSIYLNAYLGINLGAGPTDNHNPGTPGPNDYQNYPVLTSSQSDGSATTVQGSLTSIPNTSFLIQFFGSPTEDPTGNGEGKDLLGSTYLKTDGNGRATLDTGLPAGSSPGQFISATATSPSGDTSEFSVDIKTAGQINLELTGTGTPNPVLAGNQETYTFTVANQGDIAAHQVLFTDQIPAGVSVVSASTSQGYIFPSMNRTTVQASLGTIGPGMQATVTIVVGTSATMTGTITDTASVTSQEPDPDSSDETATINTSVEQAADVSIAMSATPEPVLQGGDLTYTITVADLGPSSASGVNVTLPVAAGASYVSGTSPTGSITFANGQVTASLGNLAVISPVTLTIVLQAETAGKLTETATVTSDDIDPNPANNQVTITSDVDPAADLAATIAASAPAAAATVDLVYTVTVTNNGPGDDPNVMLADTLPAAANLVSFSASGGLIPTENNDQVSVSVGLLPAGASETLTIEVDPTGLPGSSLTDTATASGQLTDPNPGNNTVTLVLPVRGISDLSISAVGNAGDVLVGQPATFKITVTNLGTASEPDAVVTSQLPQNVTFASAVATQGKTPVVDQNGLLTVDLGELASNGVAVITLIVTPQVASIGSVNESFGVHGQNVDTNVANNSASASIAVVAASDLSVVISPSAEPAFQEADWTFSLTVANLGPCDATGVMAVATLPANVEVVAASSSQGQAPVVQNGAVSAAVGALPVGGSATVKLVIEPMTVASMPITASVSGDEADPDTSNDQESISVSVSPSVSLAMQLLPSSSTVLTGHPLTMTATVVNAGPSEATQVVMKMPLPSGLLFVSATPSQDTSGVVAGQLVVQLPGSLAPGAQATVTVMFTPTIAGAISMTATATAAENDLDPQNSSATAQVSAIESPGVLQFSSSTYAVTETDGYKLLTVNRSDGSLGKVSVNYQTAAVNATPGLDYVQTSGQLSFAAGQTTQTIKIPVLADPWDNHDEYVNVALSSPLGGVLLGTVSSASLRIIDVDPDTAPPAVSQLTWSGTSRSISSLNVSFNAPLIASLATNLANYRLFDLSTGGQPVAIRAAGYSQVYSTQTFTVSLVPIAPLASGQIYEIIAMGTGATAIRDMAGTVLGAASIGQPGSNYVATFEQGTNLQYSDGSGNKVTLTLSGGGYLEQVRDPAGNGQVLTVIGEVPHRTSLSGSVKVVKGKTRSASGSSGRTTLGVINGLGNFGDVRVQITSPPFMLRRFPFEKNGQGVL